MKLSELPEGTRVKLEEEAEEEFWNSIEESGGIKQFAEFHDVSASRLYNWRNKDVFLPLEIVLRVLGYSEDLEITSVKGEGRAKIIRNPSFRFEDRDELLTRVQESVYLNENMIPVYQTDERSLLERFEELLQQFGDVPTSIYRRSLYELRYPKYLHKILEILQFEEDLGALVDESGCIEKDHIFILDREIPVEDFDQKLFSRRKRYDLALAGKNEDELAELVLEESRRFKTID